MPAAPGDRRHRLENGRGDPVVAAP